MSLFLASYALPGCADYLRQLEQQGILVLDTRYDPVCRFNPFWNKESLEQTFDNYVWQGAALGNEHHHTGKPIKLANPEQNLTDMSIILRSGKSLALLCVCRQKGCHNRLIADMLRERVPDLKVIVMGGMQPYE